MEIMNGRRVMMKMGRGNGDDEGERRKEKEEGVLGVCRNHKFADEWCFTLVLWKQIVQRSIQSFQCTKFVVEGTLCQM